VGWFRDKSLPAHHGRIVTMPREGHALIVSDLHGCIGEFEAFLAHSQLERRLAEDEPVYLVITGDVPDTARHRSFDSSVPIDGDAQILKRLMELAASYPARIFYLEGNHDFHLGRITRELADYRLRCRNSESLWSEDGRIPAALISGFAEHYRKSFGAQLYRNNVEPYDMLERLTATQLAFITTGPVLVTLPGAGVLVTHAGPPRQSSTAAPGLLKRQIENLAWEGLSDLNANDYYDALYHQLLNNRFRNEDYDLEDIAAFCSALSAELLVTGHTPHSYLAGSNSAAANCRVEESLGWIGEQQIVLCSSFGALSQEAKSYLELELDRPLRSQRDLRPGLEIRRLYGESP